MSHLFRLRARGQTRRRRALRFDAILPLEDRCLLAPFVALGPDPKPVFIPFPKPVQTTVGGATVLSLGTVTVSSFNASTASNTLSPSAAPLTSVSELTTSESFGNDIVRIKAGPGGDFGSGVYAISRGAGEDPSGKQIADPNNPGHLIVPLNQNAINKPGVIYRVDPATGKSSVFFDLNTVVSQTDPTPKDNLPGAANSLNPSALPGFDPSGLKNWYDISFDPEGYFDGRPSMFVSSVDGTDPQKNIIYRIGPDGSFLGAFTNFTDPSGVAGRFLVSPSAILVPPVQQQSFLRGLITGAAGGSSAGSNGSLTTPITTSFSALFFDSNQFTPGQSLSSTNLPKGVNPLQMGGNLQVPVTVTSIVPPATTPTTSVQSRTLSPFPEVGLTAANTDYTSPVYAAFTDFGSPQNFKADATDLGPGYSGIQGLNGESLIGATNFSNASNPLTAPAPNLPLDSQSVATTPFRRFSDIAFDQYGYFSYAVNINQLAGTGGAAAGLVTPTPIGNLFVADLASGNFTTVTPAAPFNTTPIQVPVQGNGTISVTGTAGGIATAVLNTTGIGEHHGRILVIDNQGKATVFAEGFHVSSQQDYTSFTTSNLSISFSADGTTLYASDEDGIWQFKTVTSLANATSGSLIGLNDLRTLGVPYDGRDSAVAIVDTGVDATNPSFRGRVANGTNIITNGFGNQDTAPTITGAAAAAATAATDPSVGHGTLVAGVVAQFVPQATLVPVDVFNPFQTGSTFTGGTATGGGGANARSAVNPTNAITTSNNVYNALSYVVKHPFANDPIRPNKTDRVVAAAFGFGTSETFNTEVTAFHRYPQIVLGLKNQLTKLRKLGITPVAAAGQFGHPFNGSSVTNNTGAAANTTTTTTVARNNGDNPTIGDTMGMSLPAILNEVVSVTGSYSFPFVNGPDVLPIDPPVGVSNRNRVPFLIGGTSNTVGGSTTAATANATGGVAATVLDDLLTLTNGETLNGATSIYTDRILASVNRGTTTDYTAPALDVPTFRRNIPNFTTTEINGSAAPTVATNHLTFAHAGTSLSAGEVTGAFALVSSALNYWTKINQSGGLVADAYLNMPVGTRTLNYGPHAFHDLTAWNNPDGINAILAWTAVPATDPNDGLSQSNPPNLFGSENFRQFSRIDVGNAIAAVEGYEALNWLVSHNVLPTIDTNKDGLISDVELQSFVDNSTQMGMPEAGAMARLLGGTARIPTTGAQATNVGESPDQPDVLQRRFNFFDYAADGQINGSVSITQLKMLANTLLPTPNAFTIIDRQRASANGYLLVPAAHRNFQDLQHLLPKYEFIPKAIINRFKNISPARFHVDRGAVIGTTLPAFSLWGGTSVSRILQSSPTGGSTKTTTTGANSTSTATKTSGATTTATLATPAPAGSLTSTTIATTPTSGSSTQTSTATSSTPATPAPAGSPTPSTTATTTSGSSIQTPSSSSAPDVVQAVINAISGTGATTAGTTTASTTPQQPIVTPVDTTSTSSRTTNTKKNTGKNG